MPVVVKDVPVCKDTEVATPGYVIAAIPGAAE